LFNNALQEEEMKISVQGFKGVFRVLGCDDRQGPAIGRYLAANNRPRLVALIDDATAGPLLKQARELNIRSVFAFGDGGCSDKMVELPGVAAEGMICSQAGLPLASVSKKFLDAYSARFKIDSNLYSPITYDAMQILI
jgi:ABC-type branched-subunit amino acid transport system substrate-binding protein